MLNGCTLAKTNNKRTEPDHFVCCWMPHDTGPVLFRKHEVIRLNELPVGDGPVRLRVLWFTLYKEPELHSYIKEDKSIMK